MLAKLLILKVNFHSEDLYKIKEYYRTDMIKICNHKECLINQIL